MIYKKWAAFILFFLVCIGLSAARLDDARKNYLFGDFQEAIRTAQKVRADDEVLYFLGLSYLKLGNYPKARVYLRKMLKRYPASKFYEQGAVKLADTYFLEGNFSKAEPLYRELMETKSLSNFLPLVYLRLAQIASREGRWQDKQRYLKIIKKKYPNSCEIRFVNILESYGDYFTIQVGAFSKEDNAFVIKKELDRKYAVYIVEEGRDGYTLYKVRVGKFKKRKLAEKIRLMLLEAGYPAVICP